MSEAKHTPGPWRGDCEIIGNSRVVATTAWCSGFKEEDEANARLIAASPTLYDYVARKAQDGDTEAIKIMESIDVAR